MDVQRQIEQAVRLHHAGRLDAAAAAYLAILSQHPSHLGALNGLGMIELQHRRFDSAISLLERVVTASGAHPGFLMNLGAAYDRAGQVTDAVRAYESAIAAAPTYADPYYNLGTLHWRCAKPQAAIGVFDRCMAAIGREFHALAYKAHALLDAGRGDEARYLLDHERYVKIFEFAAPAGYRNDARFRHALAEHVRSHPSLRADAMSTVNGRHTGELLRETSGPVADLIPLIEQAVHRYRAELPGDAGHPVIAWAPPTWKLTGWGVVMADGGHERPHIHPSGWISGVLYLELPEAIDVDGSEHGGWLRFGQATSELPVRSTLPLRDYRPAFGRIILFPSYFYHGTVPFRGHQPRTCISFDVEPVYG
jgi:uncharacterized protein (TIGR02466 family)